MHKWSSIRGRNDLALLHSDHVVTVCARVYMCMCVCKCVYDIWIYAGFYTGYFAGVGDTAVHILSHIFIRTHLVLPIVNCV